MHEETAVVARRVAALLVAVATVSGGVMACSGDSPAAMTASDQQPSKEAGASDASASDASAPIDVAAADAAASERATLRVLFIGDSLTYVNDVPGILTRIAETAGTGPHIVTESVVQGGAFLSDHLRNGFAQARIAEGTWTHVVLQDQSVEPAESPEYFLPDAKTFADLIAAAGARSTWFVTWAHSAGDDLYVRFGPWLFFDPDEMQDQLTSVYDHAMRNAPGSLLACVGEAFRASMRDHPEIAVVQPDHTHATLAGSYLAASTFYVALTGNPVPSTAEVPVGIAAADAVALREHAKLGSSCADAHRRAHVILGGGGLTGMEADVRGPDGGVTNPFDYGTAGTAIPAPLVVQNRGDLPATVVGSSISGPFAWTNGAYPGGSDNAEAGVPMPYPFCSSSLAAGSSCLLSVSFTGASSGAGQVALTLDGAYQPSVSRALTVASGSKDRALLTVSASPLWVPRGFGEPTVAFVDQSTTINFVVSNRGGAPTTTMASAAPLAIPLAWGVPGREGFPGGSGAGLSQPWLGGGRLPLPYCGAVLAPGSQCLVGLSYTEPAPPVSAALSIAYADALGPAATNASCPINATFPAPTDGGRD